MVNCPESLWIVSWASYKKHSFSYRNLLTTVVKVSIWDCRKENLAKGFTPRALIKAEVDFDLQPFVSMTVQSYSSLGKRHLQPVFTLMTQYCITPVVIWSQFGCLTTGLHLQLDAASCRDMILIWNLCLSISSKTHSLSNLGSVNDIVIYLLTWQFASQHP